MAANTVEQPGLVDELGFAVGAGVTTGVALATADLRDDAAIGVLEATTATEEAAGLVVVAIVFAGATLPTAEQKPCRSAIAE